MANPFKVNKKSYANNKDIKDVNIIISTTKFISEIKKSL